MNCPVRTDPLPGEGQNQNPPALAPQLTTNNSLNHRANQIHNPVRAADSDPDPDGSHGVDENVVSMDCERDNLQEDAASAEKRKRMADGPGPLPDSADSRDVCRVHPRQGLWPVVWLQKVKEALCRYAKFIGPGFMVSVAYIDPGEAASHSNPRDATC